MAKQKKVLELDDFFHLIPRDTIEQVLDRKELKEFDEYMVGQTIMLMKQQGGYHVGDIARFLTYRRKGLKAKNMPLDD